MFHTCAIPPPQVWCVGAPTAAASTPIMFHTYAVPFPRSGALEPLAQFTPVLFHTCAVPSPGLVRWSPDSRCLHTFHVPHLFCHPPQVWCAGAPIAATLRQSTTPRPAPCGFNGAWQGEGEARPSDMCGWTGPCGWGAWQGKQGEARPCGWEVWQGKARRGEAVWVGGMAGG